ncbi:25145_t:CDS:2, partial [Gigaspora margarita]
MKGGNKIKESTNRHGIIFIEHLLNNNCSQVTSWIGVQNNTKKIATGKTPKWFTDMQQTLAKMEHPNGKKSQKLGKKLQSHTGNGDIKNFYLSGREQTTLTITKQFPEITQELWSLYRSLRVPKTVRVNLIITNNVKMVDQRQSIASWEILDTGVHMLLIARTWPSLLKNALLAIRSLGACLRENSRVKLTMNYKEIKQLIDTTCSLRAYQRNQIKKHNLIVTIQAVMIILNRKQIIIESKWNKDIVRQQSTSTKITDIKVQELITENYMLIINNETVALTVALNLHIRQKKKFPNPICPRCTNEIEDEKHWLCCTVNETGIKEVLLKSLDKWAKKEDKKNKIQLTKEQKQDFLERYMLTYLDPNTNQKIEIITQNIERVIEGRHQRVDIELHYRIIKNIYKEIWIPSRRVKQIQTKTEDTIMTRETNNKE